MAVTYVQAKLADDGNNGTTGGPITTLSCTWNSNTTTGNLVFVWCWQGGDSTDNTDSWTVTDSQSNVYIKLSSDTEPNFNASGSGSKQSLWVCENITGGTTPTITVTFAGSVPYGRMVIGEYDSDTSTIGVSYVSQHLLGVQHAGGTDVVIMPSVRCKDGDVVVSCVQSIPGTCNYSGGTGWSHYQDSGIGGMHAFEDLAITTQTDVLPTFTADVSDEAYGTTFTITSDLTNDSVTYLASNGTGQTSTFTNTLSFSTTRTIGIGEYVVVCGNQGNSSVETISSIDVGGLSLSRIVEQHNTDASAEIWWAQATSTISSGSTITIVWTGSVNVQTATCLSLQSSTGVIFVRSTATGTGAGVTSTSTSAAECARGDFALAALGSIQLETITPGTGYTELYESNVARELQVMYRDIAATHGLETARWTFGDASNTDQCLVIFRPHRPLENSTLVTSAGLTWG